MRNLQPTTSTTTDSKLFHLWELLNHTADADRRYALDSVAPLEPMIGKDAAEGFRLGLIAHWRAWTPWLRSARKDSELNQGRSFDCMGLAGISLEAKGNPGWASGLSADDACRAAAYATLELNGFPAWFADLARAKPTEVRDVLTQEMKADLKRSVDVQRFGVLQDIARADQAVAELMAPVVLAELEPNAPAQMLSPAIDIVLRGRRAEREQLKPLALARFDGVSNPAENSLYIGAAFAIDGEAATKAVFAKLDKLAPGEQPALVQRVLPARIWSPVFHDQPAIKHLSLDSLERLVHLAYQTIRSRKRKRSSRAGEVYSPDTRDDAEASARCSFCMSG